MFLIDIPLKGCQGRWNRSSIVHAVSYFACGVNDTACTVHTVSLIPHAHVHAVSIDVLSDVLMKKIEGRKSCDTVPIRQKFTL
jgi:hypothetical protein